jgi:tetratricopeptide (TPR) repeat protein
VTRDYAEFGRKGELEPIGVVDIGSNSVRLVIYEGAVRSPTPIFNEKVLCGLGRQVASTGHLGEEAVERTLTALARFRAIARILRVKNIRAIATAACRDAVDGPAFIQRGEKVLGTRIQVLSGQQEAELYVRTARSAEAIPALERQLEEKDPTWIAGWIMLAPLYAARGDDIAAQRARRNATLALQNQARAYQRLARGALWRHDREEALPLFESAAEADPKNQQIADDLAALRGEIGRPVAN